MAGIHTDFVQTFVVAQRKFTWMEMNKRTFRMKLWAEKTPEGAALMTGNSNPEVGNVVYRYWKGF
jgi:hypothetical protein